jgi:hypothetical protein
MTIYPIWRLGDEGWLGETAGIGYGEYARWGPIAKLFSA